MARTNPEMHDTSDLYRSAIEAVGAKRIAHALGLSVSHVYRLQRPTMDVDPDGTGARTDLDRLETLVDLLAARPAGRPVLIEIRQWLDALFDRALGAWGGSELTVDRFHAQVGMVAKKVGEAIARCQRDALSCADFRGALRKELQEAIAELTKLDADLGRIEEDQDRRGLKAG